MSEDDNQVPSALVAVGGTALAVRSGTLVKRGLALAKSLRPGDAARLSLARGLYEALGGNWDKAVAENREALSLDPNNNVARRNLGILLGNKEVWDRAADEGRAAWHVELGDTLYAKFDLDGAIAEYREALRLYPNDANTHNNLGVALEEADRWGALEEYHAAYTLDPKNALYKRNYERLLRQVNQ